MKILNKVKIVSSKEQNKIPERITGFDLDKKPDRKHDELNENLIRYSNLIELVSDGIAIISPRGIITYCNPPLSHLLVMVKMKLLEDILQKYQQFLKGNCPSS